MVPFCVMKLSRFGICSKSDGTLGLSRVKCTLSNSMYTTCLIFPEGEFSWHDCAWDELASPSASAPQVKVDRAARRSKLTKFIRVFSFRRCADAPLPLFVLKRSGVFPF